MLVDSFGRSHHYLRISLTEACNFRCRYCVPKEGLSILPPAQYLTRAEIARLVGILGDLGVSKIRLTGGEPLLRKDLLGIIQDLKSIEPIEEISMTTNGSLLGPLVPALKEAGLDRINISLDSLDPERFAGITLSHLYHEVFAATFLALDAGFPIKLNMVVLKGLQPEEIIRFVQLAQTYPLEVRFLEFMPLCGSGWEKDAFVPIDEVRRIVRENFALSEELERGDQVAQTFHLKKGKGTVGFIGSISESFCDRCSRLRLTADGKIRPCLFSGLEFPLKDLLRGGASDEELIAVIRHAVGQKPKGNSFLEAPYTGQGDPPVVHAPMIHNIGG